MTNDTAIDRSALRDQTIKLDRHIHQMRHTLDSGKLASEALLWFADHAGDDRIKAGDVVRVRAEMVAGSTHNQGRALAYIELAIAEMKAQIVTRAIVLAQNDFKAARELVG